MNRSKTAFMSIGNTLASSPPARASSPAVLMMSLASGYRRPVPLVEPGPVRLGHAAAVRDDGADAVELQAQPGEGGRGSLVPQVQPAEGVHRGAEELVFEDVGGEVVVGDLDREREAASGAELIGDADPAAHAWPACPHGGR